MTSQPRAFFTLDLGSAATSAALLGHVGGRWRLIAHTTAPAAVEVDSLLVGLLRRIEATDSGLLAEICAGESPDIPALVEVWPRLEARTTPQRRIAVLAGSRRQRRRLETAALRAGWLTVGGNADEDDVVVLSRLVLSTETSAVLLGADHSPGGDEKRHLPDLAALVAAATRLRPELTVVLAGGAATFESQFAGPVDAVLAGERESQPAGGAGVGGEGAAEPIIEKVVESKIVTRKALAEAEAARGENATDAADDVGDSAIPAAGADGSFEPETAEPETTQPETAEADDLGEVATGTVAAAEPSPEIVTTDEPLRAHVPLGFGVVESHAAPTHVLLAPDAEAGSPAGSSLQQVLEGLRTHPNDSRLGVARSIASLAYVLDRSVEVMEVGLQGGLSSRSELIGPGHATVVSSHVFLAEASFAPANPSEEVIDNLMTWSTVALDRHRAMDRLNDLRLLPWGEADGDGAVFRLAAAKAAFGRLAEATPELGEKPMPELLVASGGILAALPPSVVALALADLVRRPGVSQIAIDQARILGPLGVIEDEGERRRMMANLADDILMPLGCLVIPAGIKPGRSAGFLRLKGMPASSEIELHPGSVQVVDLPPGRAARADFEFRDMVRLGKRGRRFSVDVGGGLSGLLVDMRDIPMRISDRPESRRASLEAWQRGMWPDVDE